MQFAFTIRLLPADSRRGYCDSIRERWGEAPGAESCGLGQTMSDVIAAMRRTLLSCTSLVRDGIVGVAVSMLATSAPACAGDLQPLEQALATLFDLNRQEVAVLATAFAVLGFSVVAAILLMRTRVRAADNEARLRSELRSLQVEADRFRALLFAEPQILVSWAAGDNRPQISGDISLLMPQDALNHLNAFSHSEPGCRRSRRCRWIMP